MQVAFGRVRRKIALLRTGLLMRNDYSEMVSVTKHLLGSYLFFAELCTRSTPKQRHQI